MKKVKSSVIEYTGGNIWVATGEFEDGTFFSGITNEGLWIGRKPYCDDNYDEDYIDWTDDYTEETFDIWEQIYKQCEYSDHYAKAYLNYFREDLEECREYARKENLKCS